MDKQLLEEIVSMSTTYREALTRLGKYYCTGAIIQLRKTTLENNIDITHLESRSHRSAAESDSYMKAKQKRHSVKTRSGTSYDYAKFIVSDSRRNDKDRGHSNNLTVPITRSLLSIGRCSYCGNDKIKLTLDRIDNSKGHTVDNVVVACVRCNTFRMDMPHEAWLAMVPVVKSVFEAGLFGQWVPFNRKYRGM